MRLCVAYIVFSPGEKPHQIIVVWKESENLILTKCACVTNIPTSQSSRWCANCAMATSATTNSMFRLMMAMMAMLKHNIIISRIVFFQVWADAHPNFKSLVRDFVWAFWSTMNVSMYTHPSLFLITFLFTWAWINHFWFFFTKEFVYLLRNEHLSQLTTMSKISGAWVLSLPLRYLGSIFCDEPAPLLWFFLASITQSLMTQKCFVQ